MPIQFVPIQIVPIQFVHEPFPAREEVVKEIPYRPPSLELLSCSVLYKSTETTLEIYTVQSARELHIIYYIGSLSAFLISGCKTSVGPPGVLYLL